ncbi:MAG: hypothetical protein Q7L55_11850 [Actinomycetota bacterium]|nr:hypothetical protein [Actinomycetota bacterium]
MTTNAHHRSRVTDDIATPLLAQQGLWDRSDIAAFLKLGKSATNEVMAAADFPAPVVGIRRYRRYVPDLVVAWALDRARGRMAERSRVRQVR